MSLKSVLARRRIATIRLWLQARRRHIELGNALLRRLTKLKRHKELCESAELAPALRPLVVLLVEDDYLIVRHVERVLADYDCKAARLASRVKDGLRILAQTEVDLAFLDVNLQGGERVYPVADELRKRRVPFAFISAHGRENVAAAYRDEIFIGKPISERDIDRFVDSVRYSSSSR